jgi:hypothetical protein
MLPRPLYAWDIILHVQAEHAVVWIEPVLHLSRLLFIRAVYTDDSIGLDTCPNQTANNLTRCPGKFDLESILTRKRL